MRTKYKKIKKSDMLLEAYLIDICHGAFFIKKSLHISEKRLNFFNFRWYHANSPLTFDFVRDFFSNHPRNRKDKSLTCTSVLFVIFAIGKSCNVCITNDLFNVKFIQYINNLLFKHSKM